MNKLDELVFKSKNHSGDVNRVLLEYIISAIEFISMNQLESGLDLISKCDEVLSSASKQSILIESDVLTLIPHTYSLYFHK